MRLGKTRARSASHAARGSYSRRRQTLRNFISRILFCSWNGVILVRVYGERRTLLDLHILSVFDQTNRSEQDCQGNRRALFAFTLAALAAAQLQSPIL